MNLLDLFQSRDTRHRKRLLDQAADINFDIDVRTFRTELLAEFARLGVRTDVAVAAMAEITGIIAAQIDEQEGKPTSITDRLHEFCARAERLYEQRRKNPKSLLSFQ